MEILNKLRSFGLTQSQSKRLFGFLQSQRDEATESFDEAFGCFSYIESFLEAFEKLSSFSEASYKAGINPMPALKGQKLPLPLLYSGKGLEKVSSLFFIDVGVTSMRVRETAQALAEQELQALIDSDEAAIDEFVLAGSPASYRQSSTVIDGEETVFLLQKDGFFFSVYDGEVKAVSEETAECVFVRMKTHSARFEARQAWFDLIEPGYQHTFEEPL